MLVRKYSMRFCGVFRSVRVGELVESLPFQPYSGCAFGETSQSDEPRSPSYHACRTPRIAIQRACCKRVCLIVHLPWANQQINSRRAVGPTKISYWGLVDPSIAPGIKSRSHHRNKKEGTVNNSKCWSLGTLSCRRTILCSRFFPFQDFSHKPILPTSILSACESIRSIQHG